MVTSAEGDAAAQASVWARATHILRDLPAHIGLEMAVTFGTGLIGLERKPLLLFGAGCWLFMVSTYCVRLFRKLARYTLPSKLAMSLLAGGVVGLGGYLGWGASAAAGGHSPVPVLGLASTKVPNVTGRPESRARAELERAGLDAPATGNCVANPGTSWVTSQSPAAGLYVAHGAKIKLSFARFGEVWLSNTSRSSGVVSAIVHARVLEKPDSALKCEHVRFSAHPDLGVVINPAIATLGSDRTYSASVTLTGSVAGQRVVITATDGATVGKATLTGPNPASNPAQHPKRKGGGPGSPPAPTVSGLAPSSGSAAGGRAVTIDGTSLSKSDTVRFGSEIARVTRATPTKLTVVSPRGHGSVEVTVQGPGGAGAKASSPVGFHYEPVATTASLVCPTWIVAAEQQVACQVTVAASEGNVPPGGEVALAPAGAGTSESSSCKLSASSSSTAECQAPYRPGKSSEPLRTVAVTATYPEGDTFAGSTNGSTVKVFSDTLQANGSFVIGDRSSAPQAPVTFWGAQWGQRNQLSGGPAPDGFEGFVSGGANSLQCGEPSTISGEAGPPPKAPLPEYIAVAVASKITAAGATLTGNVNSVVVVKANSGYSPTSHEPATGQVVGELCRQAH